MTKTELAETEQCPKWCIDDSDAGVHHGPHDPDGQFCVSPAQFPGEPPMVTVTANVEDPMWLTLDEARGLIADIEATIGMLKAS
jgi:hypothetical protein